MTNASARSGIETTYHGVLFRSRLEARWAAFFDGLGWPWEYEPFDAEGYIPDFALMGERPVAVEVKPAATIKELDLHLFKTNHRVRHGWDHDTLALGVSPLMPYGRIVSWDVGDNPYHPLLGAVGTVDPALVAWHAAKGLDLSDRIHNTAAWHVCGECGRPSFHTWTDGELFSRLCGHSVGEDQPYLPVDPDLLAAVWANAANAVRWKAA